MAFSYKAPALALAAGIAFGGTSAAQERVYFGIATGGGGV